MSIEIKELTEFSQFNECLLLQEKIFGLSDRDKIPSPYIGMLARKRLPIGIALGAFEKKEDSSEQIIGFSFSTATFVENSIYSILMGVLPEYQNRNVGLALFNKLRELALARKLNHFYCIFDVLGANLGKFYFNKIGLLGVKYEITPFEFAGHKNGEPRSEVPEDIIYAHGELNSIRICEKLVGSYRKRTFAEVLSKYPIVTENDYKESEVVLVEIPEDFLVLRRKNIEEALKWRLSTRKIFDEYINKRGFCVTELYSEKINNRRNNYYLLEKIIRS